MADGGEGFTLRLVPKFAPIVEQTTGEYQFRTAGYLDAAANVPYWDTGNAAAYQARIAEILALDPAAQAEALEQVGFSFLGAYSALGMNLGREQVLALGMPRANTGADGALSSQGADNSWAINGDLSGFASVQGSSGTFDRPAGGGIGYDVSSTSFSAGMMLAVDPAMSVGVMIGAVDGEADAFNNRGSIDTDGISLALFGRGTFGDGGAIQAVLGFQDLSFDSTRTVGALTASGSTDGSQTFLALQADYMFRQGAFSYGPTGSFERYDMSVDGYAETGAGIWNLAVGDQDGAVNVVSAGMRGEYDMGTSALFGSVTYTRASGDDAMIATGFIGLPAGVTPVTGMDQDWVDVSLGFSTELASTGSSSTRIGGEYRGSFGSDYDNHGLRLFVSMGF